MSRMRGLRTVVLAGAMALVLLAGGFGGSLIPGAPGHAPAAHADWGFCSGC